ncbi:OmpA family protein [Pelagibacterium lacus]|nr:OmpA family protein [Pelagibacterium lacus]
MAMTRTFAASAGLALAIALASAPASGQFQQLDTGDASFVWRAVKDDDGLRLEGNVPYDSVAAVLLQHGGTGTSEAMTVESGAPLGFLPDALAGLDALELLARGSVAFEEGNWSLSGEIADPEGGEKTTTALAELGVAEPRWSIAISGAETEPETADDRVRVREEGAGEPDEADEVAVILEEDDAGDAIAICRERAAAYMSERAVLFASGSARVSPESLPVIEGLADIVSVCPDAPIYVEGHTDSAGLAETNLVLSLSRAEAVVDALIDYGIGPERLYAVGYGASLPIAPNDTAAGRAQNRRIVFAFEDIAR